jgi:hypothetical protein
MSLCCEAGRQAERQGAGADGGAPHTFAVADFINTIAFDSLPAPTSAHGVVSLTVRGSRLAAPSRDYRAIVVRGERLTMRGDGARK